MFIGTAITYYRILVIHEMYFILNTFSGYIFT